ncbi:unnamed protein product [Taenia asiatica]|uniref:Pept_C1 domain-containing protein n=1 Tax=Taenia asiatica TaxID=60517 RepID=A0A0R3W7S6_TAEAS|nr:unnamed protein product [Taenia asiatica]
MPVGRTCFCIVILLFASTFASHPFLQSIWRGWKITNNKVYPTLREEYLRMRIFISNYRFIRWHNQRYYLGLETYSTALNAFADLTLKEFAENYLTLNKASMEIFWRDMNTQHVEQPIHPRVPNYIDWRKKGLVTPIKDQDGTCKFNSSNVITKVAEFVKVPEKSEEQLKISVAKVGPVSVGIDASSQGFMFYNGGIFQDPTCSEDILDHGVLVVGYNTDKTQQKYWIVKNSWGEQWGQEGYIWMARDKKNMCGIATMASYPLI